MVTYPPAVYPGVIHLVSKVHERVDTCKLSWCLGPQLAYHLFHLIHLSRGTSPGQPRYKRWDIDSLWEKNQSDTVNGIDVGGIKYNSLIYNQSTILSSELLCIVFVFLRFDVYAFIQIIYLKMWNAAELF